MNLFGFPAEEGKWSFSGKFLYKIYPDDTAYYYIFTHNTNLQIWLKQQKNNLVYDMANNKNNRFNYFIVHPKILTQLLLKFS
jgi:hypothetical protein